VVNKPDCASPEFTPRRGRAPNPSQVLLQAGEEFGAGDFAGAEAVVLCFITASPRARSGGQNRDAAGVYSGEKRCARAVLCKGVDKDEKSFRSNLDSKEKPIKFGNIAKANGGSRRKRSTQSGKVPESGTGSGLPVAERFERRSHKESGDGIEKSLDIRQKCFNFKGILRA
jgi:hypothetical protein